VIIRNKGVEWPMRGLEGEGAAKERERRDSIDGPPKR
jgi:hypothetical protein